METEGGKPTRSDQADDECSRRNPERRLVTSLLSSRAKVQQARLAEPEKPNSRTEVRERKVKEVGLPSLRAGEPRGPQPQGGARSGRRSGQKSTHRNTAVHESLKSGKNNHGGRGRSLVKRGKRKEAFSKVGERSLGEGHEPCAVLGGGPGGLGVGLQR